MSHVTEPREAEPAPAEAPRPARGLPVGRGARWVDASGALLPAALVVFFTLQAGGFFADSTGVAACVLALALALRVTLGHRPFGSLTRPVEIALAALAAYAAWTLASVLWSHAPGRALIEFNRTLLYGLCLLFASTLAWNAGRLKWALRSLTVAIYGACVIGWASRVLPEIVAPRPGAAEDRLSHPLTYWNAQGLFATLGVLLATHLACSRSEPRWVRALGAAAVPAMASTLFLTFSRGAILALLIGLIAFVVLLRSRALVIGALSVLPPTAMAVLITYDADEFATSAGLSRQAVEQGHDVALGIALCTLGGLWLSFAATRWIDRPLHRIALPAAARRPARIAAALSAVLVLVVAPLALGAPGYVSRQYDRFVKGTETIATDQRDRLLNPGNNGRIDHWRVAMDTWREQPLTGTGAGTYQNAWNQDRRIHLNVRDAHSLYAETLSDLGLVGFALLMAALLSVAAGAVWRGQRRRRSEGVDASADAVLVAIFVAWGIHAGLDWIWEMPAITAWVFALAGIALASTVPRGIPAAPGRPVRVAVGLGCLVLAVIPFQVAASERALHQSVRAFGANPRDCPRAIDRALASLESVGARPEPWEILAYCDIGAGQPRLAVDAALNAVRRDPKNWTYRYTLALVQGVAGDDPRPSARRALALNPRSTLAEQAVKKFREATRADWPDVARTLQLPAS